MNLLTTLAKVTSSLAAAFAIILPTQSLAQRPTVLIGNIEEFVLKKARIGTPQMVMVTLNADGPLAKADGRAKSRVTALKNSGRSLDDEVEWKTNRQFEIEEEAAVIRGIVAALFPNGHHDRIKLKESFSQIPQVIVEVLDVDALFELASNPQVKSILALPVPVPTGSNNLNFIGQPQT